MKIIFEDNKHSYRTENEFDVFLFDLMDLNSEVLRLKMANSVQKKLDRKEYIEKLCLEMRKKYSKKMNIES